MVDHTYWVVVGHTDRVGAEQEVGRRELFAEHRDRAAWGQEVGHR